MRRVLPLVAAAVIASCAVAAAAETVKIGTVRTSGPVFIALERGYFADEGLVPDFVYFDASQPVAVAVVSRDVEFGVAGLTGGLYSLAAQGAIRIIAGQQREAPGFQSQAYLASNRAYEAGLHSLKDLPGHSFAITQFGSTTHYALGLLAEKFGFDLKSMRLVPLQTIANMISATSGGQTDAMIAISTASLPAVHRGDAKLLGWVGDETPWQLGARTADERPDLVQRFLRVIRRGSRDYHDAFTDAEEKRHDQPSAAEILPILSKYSHESIEQIELGISYIDAAARLDAKDVLHQIEWYRAQNLIKNPVDGTLLIDRRYAEVLPEQ